MKKISIIVLSLLACLLCIPNANAQRRAWEQTELKNWSFSKDKVSWEEVSIPHSCNAIDGRTSNYYRGKAYYKCQLNFDKNDLKRPVYLLFEGAAQAATVSVNGKEVRTHKGGYTPFVVTIGKKIHEGKNEIEVCTDNTLDVNLIPVSSDFNKNNGLHNPVYLLKMNSVFFLPGRYGMYRMHVSTPYVSREKANGKVETFIVNTSGKKQKVKIRFSLKSPGAKSECYKSEKEAVIENNQSYEYFHNFTMFYPHLWDGVDDPFLYDAQLEIIDSKGKTIDVAQTKIGFRYYQTSVSNGFFLNGRSYPLRGVSEHQDWDGQASAVTKDHTYKDYEIIKELGANFVRLAHYPHNDYEFQLCDSLGIVVQTEIPWVNVCGVNASTEYFDNINQQMEEMVSNLYNHPSIIFWECGTKWTVGETPTNCKEKSIRIMWWNKPHAFIAMPKVLIPTVCWFDRLQYFPPKAVHKTLRRLLFGKPISRLVSTRTRPQPSHKGDERSAYQDGRNEYSRIRRRVKSILPHTRFGCYEKPQGRPQTLRRIRLLHSRKRRKANTQNAVAQFHVAVDYVRLPGG